MHWEHQEDLPALQPDDLLEALAVRPATWLRPFLQLAASRADPPPGGGAGSSHWYRLGPPDPSGECRFTWHPHGHPRLFTAFRGTIQIVPGSGGSILRLHGEAREGAEPVNQIAITTFTALLAVAMSSHQPDG